MLNELRALGRSALQGASSVLDQLEKNLEAAEQQSNTNLQVAEKRAKLATLPGSKFLENCTEKDVAEIRAERQAWAAAKGWVQVSGKIVGSLWKEEASAPATPIAADAKPETRKDSPASAQAPRVAPKKSEKSETGVDVLRIAFNAVGSTLSNGASAFYETTSSIAKEIGSLAWKSAVDVVWNTKPKDLAYAFVCAHPQLIGVCLAVNYFELRSSHEDYKKNPGFYNALRVAWHSLTFVSRSARLIGGSEGLSASASQGDEGWRGPDASGAPAAGAVEGGDASSGAGSSTSLVPVDAGSAAVAVDLYAPGQVGDKFLDLFYQALRDPNWVLRHVQALGIERPNDRLIGHLLAEAHTQLQRISYRNSINVPDAVTQAMNDQISTNTEDILERLFEKHPEAEGLIEQLNEALDVMRARSRSTASRN